MPSIHFLSQFALDPSTWLTLHVTKTVINDMEYVDTKTSIEGTFPENFEVRTVLLFWEIARLHFCSPLHAFQHGFDQLPWKAHLWKLLSTPEDAPFQSEQSAYIFRDDIQEGKRATLELPINSINGGRICFYLYADVGA